jgi:hypothetical protein
MSNILEGSFGTVISKIAQFYLMVLAHNAPVLFAVSTALSLSITCDSTIFRKVLK